MPSVNATIAALAAAGQTASAFNQVSGSAEALASAGHPGTILLAPTADLYIYPDPAQAATADDLGSVVLGGESCAERTY